MRELEELGFSENEARVYAANLELGSSAVADIARKAGINRTSGYNVLEGLVAKKLVSQSQDRRGRKIYAAEDPYILVDRLEDDLSKNKKRLEAAKKLLPQLLSIHSLRKDKPQVRYYEGFDGVTSLYEDSLTSSETILSYSSTHDIKKVLGSYAENYFRRRTEKGIPIRTIIPTEKYGLHLKRVGEKFLRTALLVPHEKFSISPEIYIYDNKVVFMSLAEKFGVVIEGREIAEAMKKLYELAWERAERYDREEEEKLKNTTSE
ncbi:MAG: hypothetical protein HYY55_02990 [Candidatus Niyogibacteria bacterium]|nr:MAG: hypothetical protein HYY55_02990 [Candidatus Niyogibacteria bacterium]